MRDFLIGKRKGTLGVEYLICDLDTFENKWISAFEAASYNITNIDQKDNKELPIYDMQSNAKNGSKLVMLREEPGKGYYVIDAKQQVYPVGYLQYKEWCQKYAFVDLQSKAVQSDSIFNAEDSFESTPSTASTTLAEFKEALEQVISKYEMMGMRGDGNRYKVDMFTKVLVDFIQKYFTTHSMSSMMSDANYSETFTVSGGDYTIAIPGKDYMNSNYIAYKMGIRDILCIPDYFIKNNYVIGLNLGWGTLGGLIIDPSTTATELNRFVFSDVQVGTKCIIPDSIKRINANTFESWRFEAGLDLANVEVIGNRAFYLARISSITMDKVIDIQDEAFYSSWIAFNAIDNLARASLPIPPCCKHIGVRAFNEAYNYGGGNICVLNVPKNCVVDAYGLSTHTPFTEIKFNGGKVTLGEKAINVRGHDDSMLIDATNTTFNLDSKHSLVAVYNGYSYARDINPKFAIKVITSNRAVSNQLYKDIVLGTSIKNPVYKVLNIADKVFTYEKA